MRPVFVGFLALAACQAVPSTDATLVAPQVVAPMMVGIVPVASLDAPEFLYTGEVATFDIDGPPNASFILGVSLQAPGSGSPLCPGVLGGTCLDLVTPAVRVGGGRLDASGHGSLSVTVPSGLSDRPVWFQAAVNSGGSVFITNLEQGDIVNTCAGEPVIVDAGNPEASAQGDYAVTFSSPVAAHMQSVELFDTFFNTVPTTTYASADGLTLYVDPVGNLDAFSQHTLVVTDACGTPTVASFTTGPEGSIHGDNLVGRAWSIDTDSVIIHAPAGFTGLVVPLLAGYDGLYAGAATGFDGLTAALTGIIGMTVDLGFGLEQDTCRSTVEETVDFSGDPEIHYTATELGAGQDVDVLAAFEDGGKLVHARGSAMIYALDVVRAAGLGNDEQIVCNLLVTFGAAPCEPCPYNPAYQCFFADIEASAVPFDAGMSVVTPGDVAGTCAVETPWY